MTAVQHHHSTSTLPPGFGNSSCRAEDLASSLPRFSKVFGAKGDLSGQQSSAADGYGPASTVPRSLPASAEDMAVSPSDRIRLPSLDTITSLGSPTSDSALPAATGFGSPVSELSITRNIGKPFSTTTGFVDNSHGRPLPSMADPRLQNLAADALQAVAGPPRSNPPGHEFANDDIAASTRRLSLRDDHLPSLSALTRDIPTGLTHLKSETRSPPPLLTPATGELPPLQMDSPRSESTSQILPSIRSTFGDINRLPTEPPTPVDSDISSQPSQPSAYTRSPPAGSARLPSIAGAHVSPPISPNEGYQRSLPSPHSLTPAVPYHFPSGALAHRSGYDHSQPSDASSPDRTLSNSTHSLSVSSRMSIDGMTNPQGGTYVCTFDGCTAHAFQTQYLLNSHANVHSSARPHYCPVKGCPRSEGGRGFKRKNEMIRHGLVHDSPGYVCPFCPDREHKYPRPDNLQRYVVLPTHIFAKLHVAANILETRPYATVANMR